MLVFFFGTRGLQQTCIQAELTCQSLVVLEREAAIRHATVGAEGQGHVAATRDGDQHVARAWTEVELLTAGPQTRGVDVTAAVKHLSSTHWCQQTTRVRLVVCTTKWNNTTRDTQRTDGRWRYKYPKYVTGAGTTALDVNDGERQVDAISRLRVEVVLAVQEIRIIAGEVWRRQRSSRADVNRLPTVYRNIQ